MKILIILNDAPYGNERAYNALRLAMSLQKEKSDIELTIFLMADAVGCAIPNQKTAQGYYNIERMLKSVITKNGKVKCCGTCLDARGLSSVNLIEGAERSTMQELTEITITSDKVITF